MWRKKNNEVLRRRELLGLLMDQGGSRLELVQHEYLLSIRGECRTALQKKKIK